MMSSSKQSSESQSPHQTWLNRPTRTIFIIGSGFTKAVFPEAPINNELMSRLVARNKSTKQLAELCKKNGSETKDIERALTFLDLLGEDCKDLRKMVESEIADELKFFSWDYIPEASREWVGEFSKNAFYRDDVAVCLNYDLLLETLLRKQNMWSSSGGYGVQIPIAGAFVGDFDFSEEKENSLVTVLKIHGSINFSHGNSKAFKGVRANCVSIDVPNIYKFRSEENVAIIAPSYVKRPPVEFSYMMLDALSKADQAKNMIVLGCGLRPEDPFLSLLVTRFFRSSGYETKEMLICGNDADSIRSRVVGYWNTNQKISPLIKTLPKNLDKNSMQEYLCRFRCLREDRTKP